MDIIKDERVFSEDYLPTELVHREREIREIAYPLQMLSRKRLIENVLVTGPPGTGKSTSVKTILAQLENSSNSITTFYVNCCVSRNKSSILKLLADSIEMHVIRNIGTDEMLKAVMLKMKTMGKQPLIVLDDVDMLESREIIHELLRCHESYGIKVALLSVANNPYFQYGLVPRMQSQFAQKTVVYEQYNTVQLKDILRERAKLGLFPGSYEDEALGLCAAIAGKRGDARLAISLLHKSAAIAEGEEAGKIGVSHVQKAREMHLPAASKLNEVHKRIVEAIGENEMAARELYDRLADIPERTLRKYVDELVTMKILKVERQRLGKGKSRCFTIDPVVLEKYR